MSGGLGFRASALKFKIWNIEMTKEIKLTNSDRVVLVDDEDYERLSKYKWRLETHGYVVRGRLKSDDKRHPSNIRLHREIFGLFKRNGTWDITVDHKNQDKLDNRKENLRTCSNSQNLYNKGKESRKKEDSHSIYKGVIKHKSGKFYVSVNKDKKHYSVGLFDEEIVGAKAHDQVAYHLFGEFSCLNFSDEPIENIVNIDKILNQKEYMTSKYFGVHYHIRHKKWYVTIKLNNEIVFHEGFSDELNAAKARNEYIIKNNLKRKLNVLEVEENEQRL